MTAREEYSTMHVTLQGRATLGDPAFGVGSEGSCDSKLGTEFDKSYSGFLVIVPINSVHSQPCINIHFKCNNNELTDGNCRATEQVLETETCNEIPYCSNQSRTFTRH